MSLLLDALKKAEQSKREKVAEAATGRPGPSGQPGPAAPAPGGGVELRLEPLPEEGGGAEGKGALTAELRELAGAGAEESGSPEVVGSSTLRLDMEGAGSGSRVATGELDLEEFARRLAESGPPTIDTGALGVAELREAGMTASHTMPSLKNVQSALKEFYGDSTGAGPAPRVAPPPPPASAEVGAGETQTSQRAARNVFEAKERPARKRSRAWAPLGVTAVLLAGLLVGGYYAAMSFITVQPSTLAVGRPAPLPVTPATPAPLSGAVVAQAPAVSAPSPAPPAPAIASAPSATGPVMPTGVAPPATPASTAPPLAEASAPAVPPAPVEVAQASVSPAPPAASTPPAPAAPGVAPPAAAPSTPAAAVPAVPAPPAAAAATAPQAPSTRPATAVATAPKTPPARQTPGARPSDAEAYRLALAPRATPAARGAEGGTAAPPAAAPAARDETPSLRARSSAPVRVASRSEPDPTYVRLERAYQAFQSGDYEAARQTYRQVLARDPRNRDALLGLGAVATALGERDQAQAVYRRLLIQHPQDRVATAALTNLGAAAGASAPQGEARLKQALAQDPGAPYLSFSLGNLYASQRRWSEAQQAYFNAYRAESQNADYAFNLAVSLDRLGKSRQALEYYQRALDLSDRQAAAFNPDAVRTRIQILEGAGSGGAS